MLDHGVNFFDTAEMYGAGNAEKQMGKAFKEIGVNRKDIIISTKIFWETSASDPNKGPNSSGLSRAKIVNSVKNCLERLQTDYVDVLFCHRFDYDTPLVDICKSMSWVVDQGYAHYWGTSTWPSDMISAAIEICRANKWNEPVAEQP